MKPRRGKIRRLAGRLAAWAALVVLELAIIVDARAGFLADVAALAGGLVAAWHIAYLTLELSAERQWRGLIRDLERQHRRGQRDREMG